MQCSFDILFLIYTIYSLTSLLSPSSYVDDGYGYVATLTLAAMYYNPQLLYQNLITYTVICYNPQPLQQNLVTYAAMCCNPQPLQQNLVTYAEMCIVSITSCFDPFGLLCLHTVIVTITSFLILLASTYAYGATIC